jgi:hypothetical protein
VSASGVRVRQRAYLLVASEDLDPGVVSERLGIDPDETKLRHSRTHQLPPRHLWIRRSGLDEARPLDEHLRVLLDLVAEHRESIRETAALPTVSVTLRSFGTSRKATRTSTRRPPVSRLTPPLNEPGVSTHFSAGS